MPAFYDSTCGSCRRRFGWVGEPEDAPLTCPHCDADLARLNESIRDDCKRIAEDLQVVRRPAAECSPADLARKRELAGLSVGQAVRLLDTTRGRLEGTEAGTIRLTAELGRRMDRVYGTPPRR